MKRKWKRAMLLAAVVMVLTGCNIDQAINDTIDGAGGAISSGEESLKRDVYEDAKKAVKDSISSPSTAVFPTYNSDDVMVALQDSSSEAWVSGYVDSENLMGASVREKFKVHIIYNGRIGSGGFKYEITPLG